MAAGAYPTLQSAHIRSQSDSFNWFTVSRWSYRLSGIGGCKWYLLHLGLWTLPTRQSALTSDLAARCVDRLIRILCHPRPRLRSLQIVILASFPCSRNYGKLFLDNLVNVKSMILHFNYLPVHFCDSLSVSPLTCPNLGMLQSGLTASHVIALIKARRKFPTPIRHVLIDVNDHFSYNHWMVEGRSSLEIRM